jgi:hypothetical protein
MVNSGGRLAHATSALPDRTEHDVRIRTICCDC